MYALTLALFERGLALTSLIAIASFLWQAPGLIGERGITPVGSSLRRWHRRALRGLPPAAEPSAPQVREAREQPRPGSEQLGRDVAAQAWLRRHHPSLLWYMVPFPAPPPGDPSGERAAVRLMWLGIAAAAALLLGLVPAGPACLVCGAVYLSLLPVSQPWLGLQMDANLVEVNLLYAALWPFLASQPLAAVVVMRWLITRTMLGCGLCKWSSRDKTWRDLSAMCHHYHTQPLPNPLSGPAHALPAWLHSAEVVATFLIEGPACALVLCGGLGRFVAFALFVALTLGINLTGNYGFLGLLTVVECLALLDDAWLAWMLPAPLLAALGGGDAPATPAAAAAVGGAVDAAVDAAGAGSGMATLHAWWAAPGAALAHAASVSLEWALTFDAARLWAMAPWVLVVVPYVLVSYVPLVATLRGSIPLLAPLETHLPRLLVRAHAAAAPWKLANRYAKFGTMRTYRWELVVEGSLDPGSKGQHSGRDWRPYEFRGKPGDVNRRPPWIAPHNLRLDWRVWFLPSQVRANRPLPDWFDDLLRALLRADSGPVHDLLASSPNLGAGVAAEGRPGADAGAGANAGVQPANGARSAAGKGPSAAGVAEVAGGAAGVPGDVHVDVARRLRVVVYDYRHPRDPEVVAAVEEQRQAARGGGGSEAADGAPQGLRRRVDATEGHHHHHHHHHHPDGASEASWEVGTFWARRRLGVCCELTKGGSAAGRAHSD